MKLARTLLSFLLVATCTLILPSAHATDQYEANWRLSNSGIPEPFFTMWPSRMAGGGAFSGVFPACTSSDPSDCIKSVEYQDSQSNWISGKLESYFPVDEDYETLPGKTNYKFTDNAYSTNPVKDSILPKSARSSIWTFPGIEHSGGSKFLVSVTVFRGGNDVAIANSTAQSQLSIVPFSDSIQSITKEELNGVMPFLALLQAPDLETICYLDAISMKKYCTQRNEFTAIRPIRIVVNLKTHSDIFTVIDWFTARNQNTEISMKKISDGSTDITFQGTPISVNSAESFRQATVENFILGRKILNIAFAASQSPGIKPFELDINRTQCFNPFPRNANPNQNCNNSDQVTLDSGFNSEDSFAYFIWQELEKYYPITPKDPVSVWNFKNMNPLGQDYFDLSKCSSHTEPSGVLSSNATLLVPSPPKWNKANESLDYNLASTHFDANGKVVTGFYELRVSAAVAKCLWGNDLSQAKAQIQITSGVDNAVQSLEATTLQIKDGYIVFKTSGFHYSANEIKLKIIGAKNLQTSESVALNSPAIPTASPTPTASASKGPVASIKKSISCVKGKVVKKVTAVAPKCPAGYKVKK